MGRRNLDQLPKKDASRPVTAPNALVLGLGVGIFALYGLCSRRRTLLDDALAGGVLAPFLFARLAFAFRKDPALWPPFEPRPPGPYRSSSGALSPGPAHSEEPKEAVPAIKHVEPPPLVCPYCGQRALVWIGIIDRPKAPITWDSS